LILGRKQQGFVLLLWFFIVIDLMEKSLNSIYKIELQDCFRLANKAGY